MATRDNTLLAAWLSLALAAAVGGCSSNAAPCESVYAGRCGGACSHDGMCMAGQHCAAGRCTADCAPGARSCGSDQRCTAQGRCISAADAGDGAIAPIPIADAGDDVFGCADISVQLTRRQATLMLLIDQSGSMTEDFSGTSRWVAIRRTLVDQRNGVVRPLEDEIRFGLAMYTSRNGNSGGMCPRIAPPLAPVIHNYQPIADAMNAAEPDDDTPTAESVTAAANLLAADPDIIDANRVIVLATDGEPDTCADPDAQNDATRQAMARAQSVAAVQAAFAQGIRTYVVSVGSDVSEAHLQDLANAGSGMSGTRFYRANDPAALTDAFRTITTGIRSCTFRLNGRVDPTLAGNGRVVLDGMELMYNGTDGWRLRSPNEIELQGTACERARTSATSLNASFPCDAVTPG